MRKLLSIGFLSALFFSCAINAEEKVFYPSKKQYAVEDGIQLRLVDVVASNNRWSVLLITLEAKNLSKDKDEAVNISDSPASRISNIQVSDEKGNKFKGLKSVSEGKQKLFGGETYTKKVLLICEQTPKSKEIWVILKSDDETKPDYKFVVPRERVRIGNTDL
jgi:hypothetical protein